MSSSSLSSSTKLNIVAKELNQKMFLKNQQVTTLDHNQQMIASYKNLLHILQKQSTLVQQKIGKKVFVVKECKSLPGFLTWDVKSGCKLATELIL